MSKPIATFCLMLIQFLFTLYICIGLLVIYTVIVQVTNLQLGNKIIAA